MNIVGDEICTDCGKPISFNEPSYYRKNPGDDIGQSFHSSCGDPVGIKAAIAAERERCAQIATDFMNKADVASMELSFGELYGMQCRADAAREIAEAIRAHTSHQRAKEK